MYEPIRSADAVSRWTSLGIKLPADLAVSLEIFEAVRWTEVAHAPRFDVDALTVDNAAQMIHDFAAQLVLTIGRDEGRSGLSTLELAKNQAVHAAASRVLGLARDAVPNAINQLTTPFAKAAKAYADAVGQLPDEISPETLVAAGADAVAAFGRAQEQAGYLNAVSSWVASTATLSGHTTGRLEPTLRILRPESGAQIVKLDEAHQLRANSALGAIDAVLVTAVKLGVEFGINTLAEAKQIREGTRLSPQQLVSR